MLGLDPLLPAAEAGYLGDDPDDPSRTLIRQVLGAVSQYERSMIALRLRSGRRRNASQGGYAYGAPPFGFKAEDGEVCCRGGHVFAGYLNDPEKTAETIDEEGWLHSGDIGELDEDGYLRIVDRKKELIITAGGKNISPANLEAALKTIPAIGQACTVGDQRPFVSALIVLDPEVAPGWFADQGIDTPLADIAGDPQALDALQRAVDDVMLRFSNVERVKRVTVLTDEWLPDGDELTPTSKLKRRSILAKYADRIEALYG